MSRIQQHDVRIRGADRLQRAQAVGSFKHGSAAEVGQHSAREAPHVRIIVDHQDIQTLEHFFDLLLLAMKPQTVARIAQQSTLELGLFVENDRSNFSQSALSLPNAPPKSGANAGRPCATRFTGH
jgi:hypothetical protein